MPLAREITYLRTLGFGDIDLARAAGTADQARPWPPSEPGVAGRWADHIRFLVTVAVRVEEVAGTDAVVAWTRTSMPALAWASPLDLIGQGRGEEVAELVTALEGPVSSPP